VTKTEPVKEVEVTKAAEDPVEKKKSIFASLCSCMGGAAPPKDTDKKEIVKEVEKGSDADKEVEEIAEKPADEEA
jgi:hypothetical protein